MLADPRMVLAAAQALHDAVYVENKELDRRVKKAEHLLHEAEGLLKWSGELNADLESRLAHLQEQVKACELCWTSSWVPTPEQAECEYQHPHEGVCAYCGYCRQEADYKRLQEDKARVEGERDEARRLAEYTTYWQDRAAQAEAAAGAMREALIDRRSGRPQCRYCYEYLDKPKPEHTDTCWAAAALSRLQDVAIGDLQTEEVK